MLSNLKVLELAGILAGPAVGLFFAEAGASVIKIENATTGGDPTRKWKLAEEDPKLETCAYFNSVNWNKQHLFLDLKIWEDYSQFLEHVKKADIIICNWKKGDAEKLNVTYPQLKAINPGIIYAQVYGFEVLSARTAFDIVLQAETGWLSMNGIDKNSLCKIPVAIIDLFAAHQLKEGILVALLNRLSNGKGAMVSISLWDAAIASLANQAANYLNVNHIAEPMGMLHPNIAPYGEFIITKDNKKVVLAIGTDKQFNQLCKILHLGEMNNDPKYSTNRARVINRKSLIDVISKNASALTAEEFLYACQQHLVPAGIIRNIAELFDLPEAKSLIIEDGAGKRVRSLVYKITY